MEIQQIIVLALLTEALWQTGKLGWQKGALNVSALGAMAVGIALSLLTAADLMQAAGFSMKIPFIGQVCTGLLISRGSNFIHDLLQSIAKYKQKA